MGGHDGLAVPFAGGDSERLSEPGIANSGQRLVATYGVNGGAAVGRRADACIANSGQRLVPV